jgi:hypothetical protein
MIPVCAGARRIATFRHGYHGYDLFTVGTRGRQSCMSRVPFSRWQPFALMIPMSGRHRHVRRAEQLSKVVESAGESCSQPLKDSLAQEVYWLSAYYSERRSAAEQRHANWARGCALALWITSFVVSSRALARPCSIKRSASCWSWRAARMAHSSSPAHCLRAGDAFQTGWRTRARPDRSADPPGSSPC